MLYEKRNVSLTSPPEWLVQYTGGGESWSGEAVTVESSLKVPAVLACITILSQDTASLPLILYRRLKRGKERASEHPLYRLIHDEPNPEMSSMVYRELITSHMIGWGDHFSQMIWDGRGVVRELWPLNPARMEVGRKNGERIYLYTKENGGKVPFTQDEILHIPAFGFDGLRGKSLISLARNAIGLGISAEKYASRVFKHDARPGSVLTHPKELSDNARENLQKSWMSFYGGSDNAGKVAIIEEGMDFKTIGFPPKDAMFIESQEWTVQQLSRVFRIPPHMLGDVERSTSWGTGIEQQQLGYIAHTLRPWTVRIEQYLNRSLLLEREKGDYFFSHLFDELLRADTYTRMQAYALAITNGILTRNEVREAENRLPYEGGDEPLYPLNMTTGMDSPLPSGEGQGEGDEEPPQRDLTPLLLDAARRIAKRDENELKGAIKRYEGKPERWGAWVEEFYKRDYPAFIVQTLQPFVDTGILQRNMPELAQYIGEVRGSEIIGGEPYEFMTAEEIVEKLKEVPHA